MALVRCPECKKMVSDQIPSCPQCGAPLDAISLIRADKRLGPIYEELVRLHATPELSNTGGAVRVQKEAFGNVTFHRDPSSKGHKEVPIDAAGALKILRKLPDGSGEEAIWDAFKQRNKRRRVGCAVVVLVILLLPIALIFVDPKDKKGETGQPNGTATNPERASTTGAALSQKAGQLRSGMTRQDVVALLGSPSSAVIATDTGEWALPDQRIKLELYWKNGVCAPVVVQFNDRETVTGWDEGRLCSKGMGDLIPGTEFSCQKPDRKRYCSIAENLILDIQTALHQKGYDIGKPDEVFGPKTEAAIRRYQNDNGLTADGKPSERLLKHILSNRKAAATTSKSTATPSNIIKDNYMGCLTKDALDEVITAAVNKDTRQIQALLDARLCININGLRFSVVDRGFTKSKIRVYTGDGSHVLWTVSEATR